MMKQTTTKLGLLLVLCLLSVGLFAQPGKKAPKDSRAEDLVSLAKRYFKTKNYLDAGITFDLAAQRPYNQLTTYSLHMAGISYFRLGEAEKALKSFDRLLADYPKSDYREEATFHQALTLMASDRATQRENGMDRMFRLMDGTRDGTLRDACENQIKDHLYNKFDLSFLDLYVLFAPETYKPWFTEAACFQLDQSGNGFAALEKIKTYEANGGRMTDYLLGLKSKYESGRVMNPGKMNIAIFLSLNLQKLDTAQAIPKKSLWSTQMLEGMKLALDSIGAKMNKQINVRIFDTQGDTALVRSQIDSLNEFNPDVLVGDIRSALARPISNWAEEHQVLHIIPRNPLMSLVRNKRYTFLAHPALETHGAQMALHAYKRENKRKFLVFNDHSYVSERFTNAFTATLDSLTGAEVVVKEVAREYEVNRKSVPTYIKSLKYKDYDVIYIPLSSEETAGLIISQLNYHRIEIPVMGGPDWEIFNVIDPELKTSYQLKYSTFYYEKNDSMMFDSLNAACLRDYYYQPSNYTVQGFDIMAYILEIGSFMNGMVDAGELVRNAPAYHGIHQDFFYGGQQNNQYVNIIEFQDGRTAKINWDPEESGTVPDR